MTMLEKLKKYFRETPREEIDKAWEKAVREKEGVDSPTVEEFLKSQGL